MGSKETLKTIENLVDENNRLNKELQVLRTGNDVEAYTPYRDAGYAVDVLKKVGFGIKQPNATLAQLITEMADFTMRLRQDYNEVEKYAMTYKARQDAIIKICSGLDCDPLHRANDVVDRVSRLRGTLEMVKIRLERLEKFNYNEEINQLHFDLENFLTAPEVEQ